MRIRRALATVAVLAATTGTLTACNEAAKTDASSSGGASASSSAAPADDSSAAPSGGSAAHLTQANFVDAVTKAPYDAGSAHMVMSMRGQLSMKAEGDAVYKKSGPEMTMTMTMAQMGHGTMELRLVDGIVYMTIPSVTPPGKFLKIDPKDSSNPMAKSFGALSTQMDPMASIEAMRTSLRNVKYVGPESVDGEDADHYKVTIDSAAMMRATKQKAVPGMPKTLTYDMWVDSKNLMRRVTFDMAGMTVDMSLSKWGEPVTVTAPPARKVVDSKTLTQQAG